MKEWGLFRVPADVIQTNMIKCKPNCYFLYYLFFLYLLIILNIDENTTFHFFFIGFRGGDFIDSVYVFDRLLVQ